MVPASSAPLAPTGAMLRVLRKPSRAGALAFVQFGRAPNPLVPILAGLAKGVFAGLTAEIRERVVGLR